MHEKIKKIGQSAGKFHMHTKLQSSQKEDTKKYVMYDSKTILRDFTRSNHTLF